MPKQQAFVFAKPHANTPAVLAKINEKFKEVGIEILKEGEVTGPTIDEKKYIDQHYYAIAEKATIKKPNELNVKKDKFKATFGEEWDEVLAAGKAFNALDACAKLGLDGKQLDEIWGKAKKAGKLVKMGGGFYCGFVTPEGKDPSEGIYTFNAFFMEMRGKFTAAGTSIHYYVVEFDDATLKWADFRGKVLGPTDPASAPADSLRGIVNADWEKLGLAAPCNTGDNAVHASASPFEGLAERTNWLGVAIKDDPFGAALLEKGMTEDMIKAWCVDPQVTQVDDSKGSIFDALEDKDIDDCIATCVAISKKN
jgi:nucleoside diphosphate kinase